MLRSLRKITINNSLFPIYYVQRQTFLTNDYKCEDAWNSQTSSPILTKVNLNDFYNILDQNFTSKGFISAIDVDIFANAVKDPAYLEELKDLLHKLRLSAETGCTLESTHHATIRNFLEFGHMEELIEILKDPLNFGVFLDSYTANILMDKLITSKDYEKAASVASLIMLQEEFTNDITCALCQYSCFKYITGYTPPQTEPAPVAEKKKKVEEIKIRVKFLRNLYFDDHFDLKDPILLAGKTLAWISEKNNDYTNNNLQIIGWLFYRKYNNLLNICETVGKSSFKVFPETINLLKQESEHVEEQTKVLLDKCVAMLSKVNSADTSLEESIKNYIENSINKVQTSDIKQQQQLFKSWAQIRGDELEKQTKRLDRAKRMEMIQEQQEHMKQEEQRLWFFDNEENIDLEIEEKEKLIEAPTRKKITSKSDEDYIPPEILPKKK